MKNPLGLAGIGRLANGPGEAREPAIGVAGGRPNSIYLDGSIQNKFRNEELVDRLEALVREKLAARKAAKDVANG